MSEAVGSSAIGLDIGGTSLRAARVCNGRIEAHASAPSSRDLNEVIARCLAIVKDVKHDSVCALGIGVPGRVWGQRRHVLSGGYVDLSQIDFAGILEESTKLPVVIENDASMALIAEATHGAAKGSSSVVMLTIGTGIGGALMDRGKLLRGKGTAGQLGHIVTNPGGRSCLCGRVGCVETESSGSAFATHVAEAGLPASSRIEDLLNSADPKARQVILAWASPLRRAIDSLIATNNPDCVVIGGGAGKAAVAALATIPEQSSWYDAPIVAAELGDEAGVIGAAVAATAAQDSGKRVVLVNGVPASGKSSVVKDLSKLTGWPVLALDTIKGPFLTELPAGDRVFNRTLGRASYAAMFDIIKAAPSGTTFIVDAWFGFQPIEILKDGLDRAGVSSIAEIWCTADPQVIGSRYQARISSRGPGHPGEEYVPELIDLARRASPTGLAPILTVDTESQIAVREVRNWLNSTLSS